VIDEVIKLPNGMVVVFDEEGEQMPEFQGRYPDVRAKILAQAPKGAKFFHGGYPLEKNPVARKDW
jgi:hypothetical protein